MLYLGGKSASDRDCEYTKFGRESLPGRAQLGAERCRRGFKTACGRLPDQGSIPCCSTGNKGS